MSMFQVRREALNRIGLPEVRQHRLRKLEEEQRAWEAELRKREHYEKPSVKRKKKALAAKKRALRRASRTQHG